MLPNSYFDPLKEFSGRRPSVPPGGVKEKKWGKTKKQSPNSSVCIIALQAVLPAGPVNLKCTINETMICICPTHTLTHTKKLKSVSVCGSVKDCRM